MQLLIQLLANGAVNGALFALIAVGFGLVYRTTRVFHIAYGALYVLPAYVLFASHRLVGLPLAISILLALGTGVLAGVLLEYMVYWPFFRRGAAHGPVLIASLGVYIVIENLVALVFGNDVKMLTTGIETSFLVGPVRLTRIQVVSFLLSCAALVAGWLLTRRSKLFKAAWAMGDEPELIAVLGLPLRRLRMLVLGGSSLMVAIAACLFTVDIGIDPHVGMHYLLIGAVAVFFGGLDRCAGWIAGGFTLAVLQSFTVWKLPARWTELTTFALLVLILLLRPQGLFGRRRRIEEETVAAGGNAGGLATSRWMTRLLARLSAALRVPLWGGRALVVLQAAGLMFLTGGLAFMLLKYQRYSAHLLVMIGIYLMLAYSLNLLVGYGGLLTLAHAAFYGVGAYVFTLLTVNAGMPFLPAMGCAILGGALSGLLMGLPALRFRGDAFVVTTLGFQMIVFVILYNWVPVTRGAYGISGIPRPLLFGWRIDSLPEYLALVAVLAGLVGGVLFALYRSPYGVTLKALRDDERAAEAVGISPYRQFLWAMAIAGGLAAIPGVCFASYMTYIDPTSFTLRESIFQASILLVGGSGNRRGPGVGVVLMVLLPEALRFVGLPDAMAANLREMIYGTMLVALMYWRPQGICGAYHVR
ncbi:MAG: ABC transporter permease [FCB group bacterium]|nr:ABC transporter permease [FCB group bacterium]